MIVLPLLWQVPKTFHQKFLFQALGHYDVDLDLSVLSVPTCCALKHFFASVHFQTFIPRHQWSSGVARVIVLGGQVASGEGILRGPPPPQLLHGFRLLEWS